MVAAVARKHLSQQNGDTSAFKADVLEGLRATPKQVPAKYFYDAAGSHLFERITELPEYYPTRCEMKTLREHAADIAKLIPQSAALVEFGSGSSKKARILRRAAPKLAAYVPVDVRGEMIEQEAIELRRLSQLKVLRSPPISASRLNCPMKPNRHLHAWVFPGSTSEIEPHEASSFLRNAAMILGPARSSSLASV